MLRGSFFRKSEVLNHSFCGTVGTGAKFFLDHLTSSPVSLHFYTFHPNFVLIPSYFTGKTRSQCGKWMARGLNLTARTYVY